VHAECQHDLRRYGCFVEHRLRMRGQVVAVFFPSAHVLRYQHVDQTENFCLCLGLAAAHCFFTCPASAVMLNIRLVGAAFAGSVVQYCKVTPERVTHPCRLTY
jgi:hypothetical protein